MPVFYLCGDVYKFTRDHTYAKISQIEPSFFYVTSTYNKTTKDYMKYSSKMAENRVCEIFNIQYRFSIEKQTEQACD